MEMISIVDIQGSRQVVGWSLVSLLIVFTISEVLKKVRSTRPQKKKFLYAKHVASNKPTRIKEAVHSMLFVIDLTQVISDLREEGWQQGKDILNNIASVRATKTSEDEAKAAPPPTPFELLTSWIRPRKVAQKRRSSHDLTVLPRRSSEESLCLSFDSAHFQRELRAPITTQEIGTFLQTPGNLEWIQEDIDGAEKDTKPLSRSTILLREWIKRRRSLEYIEVNDCMEVAGGPVYSVAADRTKRRIILTFQGTNHKSDLMSGLEMVMSKVRVPSRVRQLTGSKFVEIHSDIQRCLGLSEYHNKTSVCQRLISLLVGLFKDDEYSGYELYITGHSFGGALAQVFAFLLAGSMRLDGQRVVLPINCITFGSPPVGDSMYKASFQKLEEERRLRHFRISNEDDPFAVTVPDVAYQSGLLICYEKDMYCKEGATKFEYNADWPCTTQKRPFRQDPIHHHSLCAYTHNVMNPSNDVFGKSSIDDFWKRHTPHVEHQRLTEVVEAMLYSSHITYALSAIREAGLKSGLGEDLLSNIASAHAQPIPGHIRISTLNSHPNIGGDDAINGVEERTHLMPMQITLGDKRMKKRSSVSSDSSSLDLTPSIQAARANDRKDPRRRRSLSTPITVRRLRDFLQDSNNRKWIEGINGIYSDASSPNSIESILDRWVTMGNVEYIEFDDPLEKAAPVFGISVDRTMRRIIVSFRGTVLNKADDVITGLSLAQRRLRLPNEVQEVMGYEHVRIHQGFRHYIGTSDSDGVCDRIINLLEDLMVEANGNFSGYDLYVTGHSLGGALAQIFAFLVAGGTRLDKYFKNFRVTCVSFASPPVGDRHFKECYDMLELKRRLRHIRFSNQGDPITTLPYFQQSGLRVEFGSGDAGDTIIDYSASDDFWSQLLKFKFHNPCLEHGLDRYFEHTRSRSKKLFREISVDEFWEARVANHRWR